MFYEFPCQPVCSAALDIRYLPRSYFVDRTSYLVQLISNCLIPQLKHPRTRNTNSTIGSEYKNLWLDYSVLGLIWSVQS